MLVVALPLRVTCRVGSLSRQSRHSGRGRSRQAVEPGSKIQSSRMRKTARGCNAHRNAFFVSCDDHFPEPWDEVGVLLVPVGREALPHGLVAAQGRGSSIQSSPADHSVAYSRTLMTLLDATKRASWVSFARRPSGVGAAAGGASCRAGATGASAIAAGTVVNQETARRRKSTTRVGAERSAGFARSRLISADLELPPSHANDPLAVRGQ